MNDDMQDKVQTTEDRQRLYNDLPEECDDAINAAVYATMDDIAVRQILDAASYDVTKLKNPFVNVSDKLSQDEIAELRKRILNSAHTVAATPIYPDSATLEETVRKQQSMIDMLVNEVGTLSTTINTLVHRIDVLEKMIRL